MTYPQLPNSKIEKKIIYIACTPDVAISKTAPRRRGQKRELIEINGKF